MRIRLRLFHTCSLRAVSNFEAYHHCHDEETFGEDFSLQSRGLAVTREREVNSRMICIRSTSLRCERRSGLTVIPCVLLQKLCSMFCSCQHLFVLLRVRSADKRGMSRVARGAAPHSLEFLGRLRKFRVHPDRTAVHPHVLRGVVNLAFVVKAIEEASFCSKRCNQDCSSCAVHSFLIQRIFQPERQRDVVELVSQHSTALGQHVAHIAQISVRLELFEKVRQALPKRNRFVALDHVRNERTARCTAYQRQRFDKRTGFSQTQTWTRPSLICSDFSI